MTHLLNNMSSAPRDGTVFLAMCDDGVIRLCRFDQGWWEDHEFCRECNPIAWRLLPSFEEAEDQMLQQSPGSAQQTEAQTVRTELKDGSLIVLESYRPKPNVGGSTQKELREYALGEFAPFLELAEQGKIRALVVAVETDDDRLNITYPIGQWEPGLIAGTLLLQRRLLDQG